MIDIGLVLATVGKITDGDPRGSSSGDARPPTGAWFDLLPRLGVIPVRERVVRDGNGITGAGVTSGIDSL